MKITSKKELYKLLPSEYQGLKTKKLIGKVFSIGATNYWEVDYENMILTFTYENKYVRCIGQVNLKQLTKIPEINLDRILFKQSSIEIGLTYNNRYNHYYFLTSDNQILSTNINNYYSLVSFCLKHKRSDFLSVSQSYSSVASDLIKRNSNCFRKLEWNEFFSYAGELCIKDCGHFRKGMIIDRYYNHFDYKYHTRSPLDLVGNGHYAGLHRIIPSLACDLSIMQLEQLEGISTFTFSCSRAKFGCHKGCTNSCYSKNANESDKTIKNIFIKLWKECFK